MAVSSLAGCGEPHGEALSSKTGAPREQRGWQVYRTALVVLGTRALRTDQIDYFFDQ